MEVLSEKELPVHPVADTFDSVYTDISNPVDVLPIKSRCATKGVTTTLSNYSGADPVDHQVRR